MPPPNLPLLIGKHPAHEIVHRQLDRLLGRDTDQLRQHARVQAAEPLVADDLAEAVDRVVVQALAGVGAALVLHARLDQVDGVHHEGAKGARDAAQAKVVGRLGRARERVLRLGLGLGDGGAAGLLVLVPAAPRGVEHLGEVAQAQAAARLVQAGKVEQGVCLHGREEGEAGDAGGLVEELGARDAAVLAAGAGAAHNVLDQVHLVDHVEEGAHVGVRHLAALGNVAERVQVLEQEVRQLVAGRLLDDGGKLLGLDEAVSVGVEALEGLAHALALQAAQHLGELVVVHAVALGGAADVQLGPLAVPVEGDAVGALVELVQAAEVLILDGAEAVNVEQAEGDLVLGVGLAQQVLEVAPVGEGELALVCAVGDVEEDRVLLALDLVLKPPKNTECQQPAL